MRQPTLPYRGLAVTTRTLYGLMGWRIQASGLEHLPSEGPVVVASNHVSHVDPLYLGLAAMRRGRQLTYLAKRELFANPVTGPLLRFMDQIEVDRGGDAARALQPAVDCLLAGGAVAVFPEGTISTSFVPMPMHLGAARMALAAGAPVVPAAVWGGQRVFTKDRRDLNSRGTVMAVRFGPALQPQDGEDARHLTARIWQAISDLVEQAALEYPQAPRGPDDLWWVPAHLGGTAPTVSEGLERRRREAEARRQRRPQGDAEAA